MSDIEMQNNDANNVNNQDKQYDEKCCVCLENMKNDESITRTSCCKSKFHMECLDNWKIHANTCPKCRKVFEINYLQRSEFTNDLSTYGCSYGMYLIFYWASNIIYYFISFNKITSTILSNNCSYMDFIIGCFAIINTFYLIFKCAWLIYKNVNVKSNILYEFNWQFRVFVQIAISFIVFHFTIKNLTLLSYAVDIILLNTLIPETILILFICTKYCYNIIYNAFVEPNPYQPIQ